MRKGEARGERTRHRNSTKGFDLCGQVPPGDYLLEVSTLV
jgi:hypothetical protein